LAGRLGGGSGAGRKALSRMSRQRRGLAGQAAAKGSDRQCDAGLALGGGGAGRGSRSCLGKGKSEDGLRKERNGRRIKV
jgi:hypothetical protein